MPTAQKVDGYWNILNECQSSPKKSVQSEPFFIFNVSLSGHHTTKKRGSPPHTWGSCQPFFGQKNENSLALFLCNILDT